MPPEYKTKKKNKKEKNYNNSNNDNNFSKNSNKNIIEPHLKCPVRYLQTPPLPIHTYIHINMYVGMSGKCIDIFTTTLNCMLFLLKRNFNKYFYIKISKKKKKEKNNPLSGCIKDP